MQGRHETWRCLYSGMAKEIRLIRQSFVLWLVLDDKLNQCGSGTWERQYNKGKGEASDAFKSLFNLRSRDYEYILFKSVQILRFDKTTNKPAELDREILNGHLIYDGNNFIR
jgi:hypothetical protein